MQQAVRYWCPEATTQPRHYPAAPAERQRRCGNNNTHYTNPKKKIEVELRAARFELARTMSIADSVI